MGHWLLVDVLVLKKIFCVAGMVLPLASTVVAAAVKGFDESCDSAVFVVLEILTELSNAIVVSPCGTVAVLPVFTIGAPEGLVGTTGGVTGVTMGVGDEQATLVVPPEQPVCRLERLSNVLLTQPPSDTEAAIKANPQT